jgi:ATP-binding protein involved in chromosome partitioning
MSIREGSDEGVPVVVSSPGSIVSKAYQDLAQNVVKGLKELRENPDNEIQMKLNVPHSSHSS